MRDNNLKRNYFLGILAALVLQVLSAAGMFILPEVASTMNILTVIFMIVFSLCCGKWMELKYEEQ